VSAKKRKRAKAKRRRSTPLSEHKRHKKTLTPPFLSLPGGGFAPVFYHRDFLPDLLWVAAMFEEGGGWSAAYEPLDLIEEIAPPPEAERRDRKSFSVVDGRLSAFSFVPEESRADVRVALEERTPWALPDSLGHALALYPECPALWLYADWSEEHAADPDRGLAYLKGILANYGDRETVEATRLRMVPIARLGKAGKLHAPRGMVEEWSKYPGHLDEDGRRKVEASMRAMYNLLGNDEFAPTGSREWAQYFWRQNWRISTCEFDTPPARVPEVDEGELEGDVPETDDRVTVEDVHSAWTNAMATLERGLQERQLRAELDLWNPTPDEVRLGLASRALRLAHELIDDPNLWTATGSAHLVRAIIDTRITAAWLLRNGTDEEYEKFKDYGLGKNKLYKLHLEDYIDSSGATELEELREQLEREVNAEILEEFQSISLGGTFSGKSVREMAEEAKLRPAYTLNYQPLSSEAHGEWGSLRSHDLRVCTNPLHRFHRIGRFEPSDVRGSIVLMHMAFTYARETVEDIFDSYGIATADLFEACIDSFNAVIPESGSASHA
jgi:Family of unknown function (DUF5677)